MDGWVAFSEVEPTSFAEVCLTLARIGVAICASNGATYELKDFCPWIDVKPPEQTGDDMLAVARGIAMGG